MQHHARWHISWIVTTYNHNTYLQTLLGFFIGNFISNLLIHFRKTAHIIPKIFKQQI